MNSCNSLYIHIPFCAAFCDYCDFYSQKTESVDGALLDAFLNAVIADIKYQLDFFDIKKISTAYIGGGTPSVIGKRISVLFDALNSFPAFSPVEFTVEANPESATEEFLCCCREGGVNRLSLGVQTFHEPSRLAVNRIGNAAMLDERLTLASRYFPEALSADLITGLPFMSEKIVLQDIKRLLDFGPAHVSLYSLSVEGGTPLEEKLKAKDIILPDSNLSDSLWLAGRDALEEAGFVHYEVSNFALGGKRCLHNLRYWQMQGWLGAGPSASGTIIDEKTASARRYTFAPDINAYIKAPSVNAAVYEEIDRAAFLRESLLMGFRCREGPDKQMFRQRFGCSIEECIGETIKRWREKGFFNEDAPSAGLMRFLNSFLCEAFIELDLKNL